MAGVDFFKDGLRELGYSPASLPDRPDHIHFDYLIESGIFANQKIRLGLVIPQDFPMIWPTGPIVSPCLRVDDGSGKHPSGAIHLEHDYAKAFKSSEGGDWQYWSRPYVPTSNKKTVVAYMSHIWRLMNLQ